MTFLDLLLLVGVLTAAWLLLKCGWRCWCGCRTFLLSRYWRVDLRTYGRWAVVTGATSGIGKAYAVELARRGLDVVLISRSSNKLRQVAQEIGDQCGRRTRTIQVDFTDGHGIYAAIASELQGLEIGILVNNVGMAFSSHFDFFLDVPNAEEKITQVVNCNVLTVPQITKLVLPGMVERRRGLIINISSEAGVRPQPLLALYSATKAFVAYFSQSLQAEYKSRGVTVQCVVPLMVSTNMTSNVEISWLVKSAKAFAREALNTVGHSSYTSGCVSHALQHLVHRVILPDWLRTSTFFIQALDGYARRSRRRSAARRMCTDREALLSKEE